MCFADSLHNDVFACCLQKELIREVEMGPFKHTVDDGLDIRKAAFECMYTLLDSCLDRCVAHVRALPPTLKLYGSTPPTKCCCRVHLCWHSLPPVSWRYCAAEDVSICHVCTFDLELYISACLRTSSICVIVYFWPGSTSMSSWRTSRADWPITTTSRC